MPHWAKLSEQIGRDAAMAELLETNPTAACLFTWSIAAANAYGILPADPREYRACVAAAAAIPADVVEQAIADQESRGLIEQYEVINGNGLPKRLIYIRNYNRHQSINWYRVTAADYPLPDDWYMPDALAAAVENGSLAKANKQLGERGIEPLSSGSPGATQSGGSSGSPAVAPQQQGEQGLPSKGYPAVATQQGQGSSGGVADVDVDVEETRLDDNVKGTCPPPPDTPSPDPPKPEPKPETPEQLAIRDAWDAHGLDGTPGGSGYSGLVKRIQQHGIPLVQEWAAHVRASPPQMPEGSKPWPWFCARFHAAIGNEWTWKPQKRPRRLDDRGVQPPAEAGHHADGYERGKYGEVIVR